MDTLLAIGHWSLEDWVLVGSLSLMALVGFALLGLLLHVARGIYKETLPPKRINPFNGYPLGRKK